MTMISYAQNGEDVVLNRVFPHHDGLYVDVGAHDPVHLSVTKHFYDRGWSGLNIEPEPVAFASLCEHRTRDVNLNVGISDREGTLDFYEAPGATGWSTFSWNQAANLRERGLEVVIRNVPVMPLAEVCRRYVNRTIDFLKIDAESHEREVIAGADLRQWRPRIILIESGWLPPWESFLLEADYLFALFDGINRYYVRAEDQTLLPRLSTMANFLDDFVSFEQMDRIEDLKARLAAYDDLSPRAIAFTRRVQKTYRRVPGLSALVRRLKTPA